MTLSDKLYRILIYGDSWKTILGGLWVTVNISALSLMMGTVLGALVCLLRTRKNPVVRGFARVYIAILRGTPVLMLLLLLYYGVLARTGMHPMTVAVITFSLNVSAHAAELLRSALAVIRMLAKRDMSLLLVTHEMNFAREIADRVLFLADGVIYEQGTPQEIFDAPRREKTIAFIHKIKYFTFEIVNRQFDLMALFGGLQNFGEKYGLTTQEINQLQVCCEDLISAMLDGIDSAGAGAGMKLDVSYAETDHATEIRLTCGGSPFNPFASADDRLDAIYLRKKAKKIDYKLENGINCISILL